MCITITDPGVVELCQGVTQITFLSHSHSLTHTLYSVTSVLLRVSEKRTARLICTGRARIQESRATHNCIIFQQFSLGCRRLTSVSLSQCPYITDSGIVHFILNFLAVLSLNDIKNGFLKYHLFATFALYSNRSFDNNSRALVRATVSGGCWMHTSY